MANWRARQVIYDFFSRCDCSNTGFITRSTLQKECGGLNDSQIDEIFIELDEDDDGRISFEELAVGLERLREGAWSLSTRQEETGRPTALGVDDEVDVDVDVERVARELFERCDTTSSGCISRAEFNKGLEFLNLDLSEGDLDHLFDSLDQDHDGVISLSDFVKEYSKFYKDQSEDGKLNSSPLTDQESGTFEYDNVEDLPLNVRDVDLLSSAGFERVQDIWDDVRQHHPELLEPLEEVMATMTEQLKEQRNENVALMEEMSRQSVQHARDVEALDMEASEQLAEVEQSAKLQAEFIEQRIKEELSHKLTDKEDELQTAYDKVRQLEHEVAQKSVSESEMRAELRQLQKDRVRLQGVLSKTAQRRVSQAPHENHQMVKKQTLRSTKRSSSTGVLLDVNPRLPAVSESRQDLLEELEMLRTVNAELKRQVQDKDDEKAMQEKVNDTGRRKLVKKLSNLGKYLDLTGPLRKESRSSTDSCTHGDISPSDMSPRSKFLIRQITISSASSPVHSTFLHSPESVFQSISLYGTQEALSETTTKSETQVDGKNSSDNDENADKSVASHNPPNEGHLRVSTTSVENGRKPDLSVIPSHKPCHEKGISTLPHDVVLSHSPVARKQKSLSGSWPQSPLLNQDPVSELLGKDTKASSRWLNENGLSPSLKDLRQHPHWEKKKPKFLDEALAYDSSCEMIHCLPDQDIHENDSTTTSDEEDFLLERHKDGHEDGQDAGDKDRPPDPDYVKPPGTLETLQAVADRLMTSSSIRRINFDISPTQIRQTPDRMYKVVFVGNSNVGKTTLVNRLCMGEFRSFSATIGVDFRVKLVSVDNQLVSLQLWDTAGQEKYRKFGLTSQYYRKADGVILVYDVTSKESFMDIREWISCVERATGEDASMSVMVLGNKVDLVQPKDRSTLESNGKCVPLHSGESLAKQMEAQYFEVSAKTGYNIDEACATFVRTLFDRENKLMDAAKAPLRDSTKQSRPTSVIVLGDNPEYQETAKKCRC